MSDPVINKKGTKTWYVNGDRHRVDGPAVEYTNGGKKWYVDGKRHRVDGPAVIYANGTKKWYVRNIKYVSAKAFQLAANLSDEEFAEVILKHGNVK